MNERCWASQVSIENIIWKQQLNLLTSVFMVQNDGRWLFVMPGSERACRQMVVESKEMQMKFRLK